LEQDDKRYESCYLLDWNSKNAGKCLDEIIYEQQNEKLMGQQLKISETEAKVNLNAEIDCIVAEAKEFGKGLPQKSKSEKVSQIKENRKNERENMRQINTYAENLIDYNVGKNPDVGLEEMSPTLRMIKQKMEEQLKNDNRT